VLTTSPCSGIQLEALKFSSLRRRKASALNCGDGEGDAALRKNLDPHLKKPGGFPYPAAGV
jgi:hypothetical protein